MSGYCDDCGGQMCYCKEICALKTQDEVNAPEHYNKGVIECIDAIREMLGPEGAVAYCRGNVLKYLWRCEYKGHLEQDLQKAAWYLDRALRYVGKGPTSVKEQNPVGVK